MGRLDPKLHRERGELEVKAIHLEAGFKRDRSFDRGLAQALESLGEHVGADRLDLPNGWRQMV